jgi:HlyD family secretion protein
VDEADIGQVKVGQTVSFTADAFPDRKFAGKVSQVRLAATTTSNVVTYPVIVIVDNSDGTLLPGLTVNAEIEVSKREGVLKISNAALRYKPVDNSLPAAPLGGGQQRVVVQSGGQRGGGMLDDLSHAVSAMKLNAQQQAAFDAALATIRERQQARRPQQGQGGGGGGPGGGMMVISSGGNMADAMSKVRQMMADRFKQDFAAFRDMLSDEQKAQWDGELSGLLNAKRATLYRLVNDKPEPVTVRVGASDGTDTEISGGGIKEGDQIITGERAKDAG